MRKFQLQRSDKGLINSILDKVNIYQEKHPLVVKIDFKTLYKFLTKEEKAFTQRIIKSDPKHYGFKGPHYGVVSVPKKLVVVRNQKYYYKGEKKILPPQLVPKQVYAAYRRLNRLMEKDISRTLLVESGYRSPAYQLIVFLYYLKLHKWNLAKTAKRVALPGYSEHGYPPRQALDFITADGIPSDKKPLEFTKTEEYKWLLKNAGKFNFYLSYPRNNKWGVMFEPWHWAFLK